MKKVLLATVLLVMAAAAQAQARVDFNVNIDVPLGPPRPVVTSYPAPVEQVVVEQPPRFIYSRDLGVYVTVDNPYDMVYTDDCYYVRRDGNWYVSTTYGGPWVVVQPRRLPYQLRHYRYEQIRYYRDREYRAYLHDREHYRGTWYQPVVVSALRHDRWDDRRGHWEDRRDRRWDHDRDRRWDHDRDGRWDHDRR